MKQEKEDKDIEKLKQLIRESSYTYKELLNRIAVTDYLLHDQNDFVLVSVLLAHF